MGKIIIDLQSVTESMGETKQRTQETDERASHLGCYGDVELHPVDVPMDSTITWSHIAAAAGALHAMAQEQACKNQSDAKEFRGHVNSRISARLECDGLRQTRAV